MVIVPEKREVGGSEFVNKADLLAYPRRIRARPPGVGQCGLPPLAGHARANAICPGTVHTPFVEGYLARNFAGQEDTMRRQLHTRQPIRRMGEPQEIAAAVLYLASDEAACMTGSSLVIDGGWTAK